MPLGWNFIYENKMMGRSGMYKDHGPGFIVFGDIALCYTPV